MLRSPRTIWCGPMPPTLAGMACWATGNGSTQQSLALPEWAVETYTAHRNKTRRPRAAQLNKDMHKSRLGNITIDCQTDDLLSAAQFWSSALGYPLPSDLDASSGFIKLVTPPGDVQVIVQRVTHQSWAHLDIEADSIDSEILRLEGFSATVVSRKDGWVVMQAPSGHRFCVGSPYRAGFDQGANTWD